jgi:hypothetical protein
MVSEVGRDGDGVVVPVGLATEFHFVPKKICQIRYARNSFRFPQRKKVLIPRHSEVYGRFHSEARNGTE